MEARTPAAAPAVADVEVDPRTGLKQDSGADRIPQAVDQAPDAPAAQEAPQEKPADVIDTLRPKAAQKQWTITDKRNPERIITKEYVQKPLSYFGKMEFFGLVGEVIDKAVSGEDGLRISSLFDVPGSGGTGLTASDFQDADTFVQAVGKLLTYAPDFLQKCYAIWLGVPQYERPWAIEVMSASPDAGGLTDEEGFEIIEIFIDQNWEALEGFFRDKLMPLRDRVQARRQEAGRSQPSKPSNGTQQSTASE